MKSTALRHFIKCYVQFYVLMRRCFGIAVPGLNFLAKQIDEPFLFSVRGKQFAFEPNSGTAYYMMLGGYWNEPETHKFLDAIYHKVDGGITLIEVGSSIGEFAIDSAGYRCIDRVYAFEPLPSSSKAIKLAADANQLKNVQVIEKAVSNLSGKASFRMDSDCSSSHIAKEEDDNSFEVACTTLDEELPHHRGPSILLIDTEGNELNVIKGAAKLISANIPLIIFEYNWVSKNHYTLAEIQAALGGRYTIYRLRKDGLLDADLSATWNCVAIPENGIFHDIISQNNLIASKA